MRGNEHATFSNYGCRATSTALTKKATPHRNGGTKGEETFYLTDLCEQVPTVVLQSRLCFIPTSSIVGVWP